MMEKMPLAKLNGPKIYNAVVKGNKTLRQLAEGYECSYEQFIAEARKKIGPFEWLRVEKADKKNQKKDNRKDDTAMKEDKKFPRSNERQKQNIREEMEFVAEKLKVSQSVLEDFTQRAQNAQRDEAVALQHYQEAVARSKWTVENRDKARKQLENYQGRMEQLQKKLEALDVYLVAPGYKGEMPRGKLVSVVPFEGYNMTVERGDDLLNDVSFTSMLDLGFETLKDANTALEFAKLVLKYQLECEEEYRVLVDDEKIITILYGQEVDI